MSSGLHESVELAAGRPPLLDHSIHSARCIARSQQCQQPFAAFPVAFGDDRHPPIMQVPGLSQQS